MSGWIDDVQEKLSNEFPRCFGLRKEFLLGNASRAPEKFYVHRMQDIDANVEHVAVVADTLEQPLLQKLPDLILQELKDKNAYVASSNQGDSRNSNDNAGLVFSRSVYLFVESITLDHDQVRAVFDRHSMKAVFRDAKHWNARMERKNPDAFICHDSRDKAEFVDPLVHALSRKLVRVWYDKYSLRVGESLIEAIDEGLKVCRFGIIVVSESFISRRPWPAREYRSLETRELAEGRKVILPIRLGVTSDQVRSYSLALADKVALNARDGIEETAQQIWRRINEQESP